MISFGQYFIMFHIFEVRDHWACIILDGIFFALFFSLNKFVYNVTFLSLVGVVADGGDPGIIHLRYIISYHCLSALRLLLNLLFCQ